MIQVALYLRFRLRQPGDPAERLPAAQRPSRGDRILALDTMVINSIAIIVLFGISQHTTLYFEVALLLAMVGFVSTVAYCKFILRGDIVE
jgi:multicomponent K+:H+ antiporter subunit F